MSCFALVLEGYDRVIGPVLTEIPVDRHDSPLLGPTLKAARTQVGAMPEDVNVNLDRGYDSAKSRALPAESGCASLPSRSSRRTRTRGARGVAVSDRERIGIRGS
ncbi:hypothetical protein [Streptomyces acidiscabies]|uniref:hypothetical protein n=1 Tax=Streptomyces acidiscabies TaxID=42234 RepID=UPI0038F7E43B